MNIIMLQFDLKKKAKVITQDIESLLKLFSLSDTVEPLLTYSVYGGEIRVRKVTLTSSVLFT